MVWHDCYTISSHSYFTIMVSTMYDPAVYLANNEYLQKYKCRIDVQETVEQPQLHILGRCPSNEQQLLYGEKRISDIINSKNKLETEAIYIEYIVRVFKGDKPASQFEIGHQKGAIILVLIVKQIFSLLKIFSIVLVHITFQYKTDLTRSFAQIPLLTE